MKFISCTGRTRYDRVASRPYVIMEGKYLSELKESLEYSEIFCSDGVWEYKAWRSR